MCYFKRMKNLLFLALILFSFLGYAEKINDFAPEDYIRLDHHQESCVIIEDGLYKDMVNCVIHVQILNNLICPEWTKLEHDSNWVSIAYLPDQCKETLHGYSCFLYTYFLRKDQCKEILPPL